MYRSDPQAADSVARDLGVTLVVQDTLFSADERRAMVVCEVLDRVQFDLPQFTLPGEIDNRAARRRAKFSRRTNSDGWKP
ncbi:hypothetical protein AB4Y42_34540 [Paraburkholderia sp. EG286B]